MADGPAEGAAVILNLHGVGDPAAAPRRPEPGEAGYWISEALFRETAALAAEACARGRAVALTFDDGNVSDLAVCAPVLAKLGVPAEFFPLAGRIGERGSLSAADLRELAGMGMGLGSHGWGHVDWRRLDEAGRRREFLEAPDAITQATGLPARRAAVPFGRYDRRVLSHLRAAGATQVLTSDGGPAGDGWLRPRTSLTAGMTRADVAALIEGRERPLRRWRRRAGMLKRRLL